MSEKPPSCSSCKLATIGKGFLQPIGPENASICFIGETQDALGGEYGGFFKKLLTMADISYANIRIHRLISCNPPNGWLHNSPWEQNAIQNCSEYLNEVLRENHAVVVPLGELATRVILGLNKGRGVEIENFSGTIQRDPLDRFWVMPTFSPKYVSQGNKHLTPVVWQDLLQIKEVAAKGWTADEPELVIDPSVEWFDMWAREYEAAAIQDPENIWLDVDIETPDKQGKLDESALEADDVSYEIIRINFSHSTNQGITIPYVGPYIDIAHRILNIPRARQIYHNWGYDVPRLKAKGCKITPDKVMDSMDAFHFLHTRLPKGLGFVASRYSNYKKAWKHLSGNNPGMYAALDGVQGLRSMFGIASELQQERRWNGPGGYLEHMYKLDTYVLRPMESVGLNANKEKLVEFGVRLKHDAEELYKKIQPMVPVEVLGLHGDWIEPPDRKIIEKLNATRAKKDEPLLLMPDFEVIENVDVLLDDGGDSGNCLDFDIPDADAADAIIAAGQNGNSSPSEDERSVSTGSPQRISPHGLIARSEKRLVSVCTRCNEVEAKRNQWCADKGSKHVVEPREEKVTRYFVREEFNPGSTAQKLAYLKFRGHKPGIDRKTKKETVDKNTLQRLRKTGDPIYKELLEYAEVTKIEGTYVTPNIKRIENSVDGRIHGHFDHKPWTLRLASHDPNLTNLVSDKD